MSYSEDYPSFTGDQTGQLLAEPDMVALSPVTSARVVETQSGYLVIIKKADDRLSLSVKRRIGTPPSSNVILTSDESVQLSRVLTDSVSNLNEGGDFVVKSAASELRSSIEETGELATIYGENQESNPALDWDEIKQPWRKRRAKQTLDHLEAIAEPQAVEQTERKSFKKPLIITGIVVGAALIVVLIGTVISIIGSDRGGDQTHAAAAKAAASNPLASDKVDKFVRNFVANMLDFHPKTYRASQIQAMSVMAPELMERYWQETSFPLSKGKLKQMHKEQTLMINKVLQQPTNSSSTDVEMSADLASDGESESTPIRLNIQLGLNSEGQITILEMKDASKSESAE